LILSVASGKGGTGKTVVAVNLALALADERRVQLLDCDVEEPNDHIFLNPSWADRREVTMPTPEIDRERCDYCGHCAEVCNFHVLAVVPGQVLVFPELCHGCGACVRLCPSGAVSEVGRPLGEVQCGPAGEVAFCHGRLNPGEAISPPVIDAVRDRIDHGADVVILDCPPGTACPVVAAVRGTDFCLLVTEPTPFGLNDLELAADLVKMLGLPAGVVINRADIGDDRVHRFCERRGLPILLELPYDEDLARRYARGEAVAAVDPEWRRRFRELYDRVCEAAGRGRGG